MQIQTQGTHARVSASPDTVAHITKPAMHAPPAAMARNLCPPGRRSLDL
jgi:hypothetical protein